MSQPHTPTTPDQLAEQVLKVLDKLADQRSEDRGSLVDARRFDERQRAIELDFRALLSALGRGDKEQRIAFLHSPVLAAKKLTLTRALPPDTDRVYAYGDGGRELWHFEMAYAGQ